MYSVDTRYISDKHSRDDYLRLNLTLSSPVYDWESAINIIRGRLGARFIEPMNLLIDQDENKYGFAAIGICCLLIETLMQFREGYDKTPDRQNQTLYSEFLQTQFNDIFNHETADAFYTNIRCGILHSAETAGKSSLILDRDYPVFLQGNGVLMVNPKNTCNLICQYFEKYCNELSDPANKTLRTSFINKMDHIAKKNYGADAINSILYSFCTHEGEHIRYDNNSYYIFKSYTNRESIKIYKILENENEKNVKIWINPNDVQTALYYWPNVQAIKLLDNGNYILPLFNLCKNLVEEIKQKRIA